jgi:hypothetical protein
VKQEGLQGAGWWWGAGVGQGEGGVCGVREGEEGGAGAQEDSVAVPAAVRAKGVYRGGGGETGT